jgi:hypothetical protein
MLITLAHYYLGALLKFCVQQQATRGGTLFTCWEDGAVVKMLGRPTRELGARSEGCQSFHLFSSSDWQIIPFYGHEGRVRCWLISRAMSARRHSL